MEQKKGKWERFGAFWERLHYGFGAIALGGALVFPAEQTKLLLFSVWEFGHGLIWGGLKNIGQKKGKAAGKVALAET